MQTFIEWLEQEHPEILKEGDWGRRAMGAALIAGGLGLGAMKDRINQALIPNPPQRPAAVATMPQQDQSQQQADGVGPNAQGQIEARATVVVHRVLGTSQGVQMAKSKALQQAKQKLVQYLHGGSFERTKGGFSVSSSGRLPTGIETRVVDNGNGTVTGIATLPQGIDYQNFQQ